MNAHQRIISALCVLTLIISPFTSDAHPQGVAAHELWREWGKHDAKSTKKIDHSAWQQFLDKYLRSERGINRIRYRDVNAQDKNHLYDYIWLLSKKNISEYNRDEQLAYWINLYNACVVKMILESYPIDSINEISTRPGIFRDGPWDIHRIRVNHVTLSLSDIKHEVIFRQWNDHRTLYALSDGVIGAPEIQRQVFTAENLNHLLEKATHDFINSKRTLAIIDNKLMLSQTYQNHLDIMGISEEDILNHIRQYANEETKKKLQKHKRIHRFMHNLHINDATYI